MNALMEKKNFNWLRLGRNIRLRRKLMRLTQVDLAQRVGCGVQAISDLERGKRLVTVDFLFRLSRAMDYPVSDMLQGVE